MSEAVRDTILELKYHRLKGEFPDVPIDTDKVDIALLTDGEEKPFYITLPIAKVGETSANGLVYDEGLVTAIESQLVGLGGIRGHQRDDDLPFSFPHDSISWVGVKRVGEITWAKGYIPPGKDRDDARMRIARGGGISTSIFGNAVREMVGKGRTWKAKDFALESLDLGDPSRVALRLGGAAKITREFKEGEMPEITSVAEVPQNIREQILREGQDAVRVTELSKRVSELETANKELETQVAEAANWKSIVAEIRGTIGKDTDTVQIVTEYHNTLTKLGELMGVPYTNITVRIEEMHETLAELKRKEFDGAVDAKIAELTNWNVHKDEAKAKVAAFRKNMKRAVVGELKGVTEVAKIAETAQKLWDEEFKPLSESLVLELAGPAAVVHGKSGANTPKPLTPQEIAEARARTGI